MSFKYSISQKVKIEVNGISDVEGVIKGRAEYENADNQYVVSYNEGNSSDWFLEPEIKED